MDLLVQEGKGEASCAINFLLVFVAGTICYTCSLLVFAVIDAETRYNSIKVQYFAIESKVSDDPVTQQVGSTK